MAAALASGTIHRAGGMVSAAAPPAAIRATQNRVVAGNPWAPGLPNIKNGTPTPRADPPSTHQEVRACSSRPNAKGTAARPTNAGASGLASPATSRPMTPSARYPRRTTTMAPRAMAAPTANATRPESMFSTAAMVMAQTSTVWCVAPLASGTANRAIAAVARHSRSKEPVSVDSAGTISE